MSLKSNPNIYRAKLNCQCGRDVLDGKIESPAGASKIEFAMCFLFGAIEEIADELELKGKEAKCQE